MINKKILIILFSFLLLTEQTIADENIKVKTYAKYGSYLPDSVLNEAYQKGHDAGFISGIVSKNVITETYRTSENAGYKTGKVAKRFWKKLWN